jgi:hypothetical protein
VDSRQLHGGASAAADVSPVARAGARARRRIKQNAPTSGAFELPELPFEKQLGMPLSALALRFVVVPVTGIELVTFALRMRCSTN